MLVLLAALALAEEPVYGPEAAVEPVVESVPEPDPLFERLLGEEQPAVTDAAAPLATAPPELSMGGIAWGLGIAGVGALAVLAWRRREGAGEAPAPSLQVVARCAVDAQCGLAVVEFGGRRLVLGTGAQPPVLLADFGAVDDTEEEVPMRPPRMAKKPAFSQQLDAAQELVQKVLKRRQAG